MSEQVHLATCVCVREWVSIICALLVTPAICLEAAITHHTRHCLVSSTKIRNNNNIFVFTSPKPILPGRGAESLAVPVVSQHTSMQGGPDFWADVS